MVLKGGVLLAAFGTRRPTRDVDLQATDLSNDVAATLDVVREIAALPADDGLVFDTASASAVAIRDADEYSGVRVDLLAVLSRARLVGYERIAGPRWQQWRAKQRLEQLPSGFDEVLARTVTLADPAIAGEVGSAV